MSNLVPRRIKQRYDALVRIFSARSDITVRFEDGGHPVFIPDRKLIILPNGDFSDPVFAALCEGFIVHEAGHTRYTEQEYYEKALSIHRRLMSILNLFDDVQMEFNSGQEFPGAKARLGTMYTLLSEKGWFTPDVPSAHVESVIEMYILNRLRQTNLGQVPHEPTWDTFSKDAIEKMGELVPIVENAIEKASGMKTTEEAYEHARALYELFKELAGEDSKPEENDQQQTDDPQPDEDQAGNSSDECPSDGQSSDNPSDSNVDETAAADEEISEAEADGTESRDNEKPGLSDGCKKLLRDFLSSLEELPDYHEQIKDEIKKISAKVSDQDLRDYGGPTLSDSSQFCINQTPGFPLVYLPDEYIVPVTGEEIAAMSNTAVTLRNGLSKLLIQRSTMQRRTSERGRKFSSNRLVQVSTGVTDVFRSDKRLEAKHDVAILSLRDISGSMLVDDAYCVARHCEMALAKASEAIPQVHIANGVYPYYDNIKITKNFHEKLIDVVDQFGHAYSGFSTPTGPSIDFALAYLINIKVAKRVLLVTTDGQPDSVSDVTDSIAKAKALGIIVAGIGVGTSAVEGFDIFETVQTPSELGPKFYDLVMKLI